MSKENQNLHEFLSFKIFVRDAPFALSLMPESQLFMFFPPRDNVLLNERAYWWDDVCKDFNMLCLLKVHSSKPTVTQLFVNYNHNVCCCLFVLKSLSLDSLCIKINKQIVTDDNLVNYLHFWFIFPLSYVHNSTLHYQPLCKPSSRKWFSYRSGFLNWGLLLYLK